MGVSCKFSLKPMIWEILSTIPPVTQVIAEPGQTSRHSSDPALWLALLGLLRAARSGTLSLVQSTDHPGSERTWFLEGQPWWESMGYIGVYWGYGNIH